MYAKYKQEKKKTKKREREEKKKEMEELGELAPPKQVISYTFKRMIALITSFRHQKQ